MAAPAGRPYPTSDSPYQIVNGRFGTWDCGKQIVWGPLNGEISRLYTYELWNPPIPTAEQWIDGALSSQDQSTHGE